MATTRGAKAASEPEKKAEPAAQKCVNCGEPATVLTAGRSANRVGFCKRCTPAILR